MRLLEFTVKDLLQNTSRKPSDREIRYGGFSFRTKNAYFKMGDYRLTVRLTGLKIVSRTKGSYEDKVRLAMESDIEVKCSCPDFGYGGFAYIGTQLDYSLQQENREPIIRNPTQSGTVCKHLVALLTNIQEYADEIAKDIELSRTNNYRNVNRI